MQGGERNTLNTMTVIICWGNKIQNINIVIIISEQSVAQRFLVSPTNVTLASGQRRKLYISCRPMSNPSNTEREPPKP